MSFIDEFFIELNNEGELKKYPSLLIMDLPKETDIQKGNLKEPNSVNLLYVFATTVVGNGYLEIKVNTKFDIIFAKKNSNDFEECSVILRYVNMNPRYQIDYLPGGAIGLCLLEFPNGKPELFNKLKYYGEKKDYNKHDTIILTQRIVIEKLLNSSMEKS
ncbi:hypothetical protein [Flavobacterium collinsii]|uniref:Uncharacterized protein n=1 Tax=Flavobacterium collinsii TaxID=1114861 RepID=A0ABN7EP72_9FLAO|nr:hypothetical protein [Flavobacterium collinsii]CAA9200767.1 hypothetical protein FLACOL7796_03432 [Flavobacterium collinsii]